MSLPTSSVIPTVKAALVIQLAARPGLADVDVNYGWAGLLQEGESITLDPPDQRIIDAQSTIPTMKGGRHSREETFQVVVCIQVFSGELDSDDAAPTEARAFAILAELDDLLASADGPKLSGAAGSPTLTCILSDYPRTLIPFEHGWLCRIDALLSCSCRLT